LPSLSNIRDYFHLGVKPQQAAEELRDISVGGHFAGNGGVKRYGVGIPKVEGILTRSRCPGFKLTAN